MPRKSDALTVEELQEILSELLACKLSDSVKAKIDKRIRAEITRREKAGEAGGRPKGVRETMREIDRTAYRAFNERENKEDGPIIDDSQDWGA